MLLATSGLCNASGKRVSVTTAEHGTTCEKQLVRGTFTLQMSPIRLPNTLSVWTIGRRQCKCCHLTRSLNTFLTSLSAMINDALEIWLVDPSAHKNEIARTTFLKGKLLSAMGKMQKASIALKVACRLRKEITKEDRDLESLTMEDFDDIVAFWAR